jgi:hypothetical protein
MTDLLLLFARFGGAAVLFVGLAYGLCSILVHRTDMGTARFSASRQVRFVKDLFARLVWTIVVCAIGVFSMVVSFSF